MTDDTKQPEDPSEENSGSSPAEDLDAAEGASTSQPQDPPPSEAPQGEDSPPTENAASTAASGEMEPQSSVSSESSAENADSEGDSPETSESTEAPEKPKKSSGSKSKAAKASKASEPEDTESGLNGADSSADAPAEDVSSEEEDGQPKFDWYILKVASNREESVRDALMRRVKIEGLEEFFKEVIVPTETISEYKGGKRRTKKQKLWPGYLVANMAINDDTWFIVRETPGIGDFTGAAGKPTPMQAEEVERVLALIRPPEEKPDKARAVIAFSVGDRVKINEGTFQNFEGQIEGVDEANGHVTVMINIFGRSTPVELAYWQVEAV